MSSVLDNIRAMREKAKSAETKYFTSKGGKNLSPGDLKEGKTLIRVAPSHSEKFPSPFVPFRSTYIEVELEIDQMARYNMTKVIAEKKLESKFNVEKIEEFNNNSDTWDDDKMKANLKKLLGESFTMKANKRVSIATLHGKEGSKDLIEEYIKFVVAKINSEIGDRDEAKKKQGPLFGFKSKDGKWNPGLNPSTNFLCYGWDWTDSAKPFYKIELWGGMMNRIEELYLKFDSEGEPLIVDPFSSPTEGIALQFDKVKNEKGKWDYKIEDSPYAGKRQSWTEFVAGFELKDDQMKQLEEVKSLQELFGRGSFKASDFKLQLSGLVLFDEKHGYNAFEEPDFLNTVEEISNMYTSEETEDKEVEDIKSGKDIEKALTKKPASKTVKKEVVKESEPEVDEEENSVREEDYQEESEVEQEEETKEEVKSTGTTPSLQEKLAALRKNMKK